MPPDPVHDPCRSVTSDTGATTCASRIAVLHRYAPGLMVCAVASAASIALASLLPAVSPLLISIVVGAVIVNVAGVPERFMPGIALAARTLLRAGIALLGLELLLGDIVNLGWAVLGTVVAVVAFGILGTWYLGGLLGVARAQRLLIACGFSLCGAAAVAAAEGVADADEEETVTAIALVVVFGTVMIPVVPALSALLGLSSVNAGVWAGASIHEVAQVVAAGSAIGGTALGVAVIVKLARVLLLAPAIVAFGLAQRRRAPAGAGQKRPPLVPTFIVAFVACVAVRSTGMVPEAAIAAAHHVQTALLTAAMFALGTGVKYSTLRTVGLRPVALAGAATLIVAGVALAGTLLA